MSHDDRVDPVGACVGMKGSRVQNIVKELGGERIDIVPWSADPKILVSRALSPARVLDVIYDEAAKKATVVVADDQIPLAIGRGGQNARLAAKLTELQILLVSQSQVEAQKVEKAGLGDIDLESLTKDLGPKLVEKLVKSGKETLQDVMETSIEDLMEIPGVGEKTAQRLLLTGAQILEQRAAERNRRLKDEAEGRTTETEEGDAEGAGDLADAAELEDSEEADESDAEAADSATADDEATDQDADAPTESEMTEETSGSSEAPEPENEDPDREKETGGTAQ